MTTSTEEVVQTTTVSHDKYAIKNLWWMTTAVLT